MFDSKTCCHNHRRSDFAAARSYWRAWRFTSDADMIDWELNILLAEPGVRGRGLGSASQALAVQHLLGRPSTRSVFAYTAVENHAERRALQKAGLREGGTTSASTLPGPDSGRRLAGVLDPISG